MSETANEYLAQHVPISPGDKGKQGIKILFIYFKENVIYLFISFNVLLALYYYYYYYL
jgi:hypothetical protein